MQTATSLVAGGLLSALTLAGCIPAGVNSPVVATSSAGVTFPEVVGIDLEGNEVSIEADELEARLFQHELDHLDGVLIVDHLDEDQLREANRFLRERTLAAGMPGPSGGGLRLS